MDRGFTGSSQTHNVGHTPVPIVPDSLAAHVCELPRAITRKSSRDQGASCSRAELRVPESLRRGPSIIKGYASSVPEMDTRMLNHAGAELDAGRLHSITLHPYQNGDQSHTSLQYRKEKHARTVRHVSAESRVMGAQRGWQ